MYNQTILIEAIRNLTESEGLKYISTNIFSLTIIVYLLMIWILTLLFHALTNIKNKTEYFVVVFLIPQLLGLVYLFFSFVVPIIPKFFANTLNIFGN